VALPPSEPLHHGTADSLSVQTGQKDAPLRGGMNLRQALQNRFPLFRGVVGVCQPCFVTGAGPHPIHQFVAKLLDFMDVLSGGGFCYGERWRVAVFVEGLLLYQPPRPIKDTSVVSFVARSIPFQDPHFRKRYLGAMTTADGPGGSRTRLKADATLLRL